MLSRILKDVIIVRFNVKYMSKNKGYKRKIGNSLRAHLNVHTRIPISTGRIIGLRGRGNEGFGRFARRRGWTSWRQVYLSTLSFQPVPL